MRPTPRRNAPPASGLRHVAHRLLSSRDRNLVRFDDWAAAKLATIDDPGERQLSQPSSFAGSPIEAKTSPACCEAAGKKVWVTGLQPAALACDRRLSQVPAPDWRLGQLLYRARLLEGS